MPRERGAVLSQYLSPHDCVCAEKMSRPGDLPPMPSTAPMPSDRPDLLPDALRRKASEEVPSAFPILVAVAADDCTPATLKVASALASQRGATPTLLYVMELVPY